MIENASTSSVVVSLQRTGFSLMLSILNEIHRLKNIPVAHDVAQTRLNKVLPFLSQQLNREYVSFFSRYNMQESLLFNGEFQLIVGGPKWVNPDYPDDIFVRKYFGIKDKGDFLLAVRYPKALFDYYPIMHSTKSPESWVSTYGERQRNWLTSYRNPIDVFNSAAHSINALTSEYISRFMTDVNEEAIRQEIGLSKLSDPKVCRGLIKYQIDYWNRYFTVAQFFKHYRWEDLILDPISTIQYIGSLINQEVSAQEAEDIWKPRDHKNLLSHHQHNFRINKGVVGDWKNSIIPQHIKLFEELGGGELFSRLGYDFPCVPERQNEYQKQIQHYWDSGKPYEIKDKNLAGFAFNKSNIDASEFSFTSFPERGRVSIERSDLEDEPILREFQTFAAEKNDLLCSMINKIQSLDSDAHLEQLLRTHYPENDVTAFLNVALGTHKNTFSRLENFLKNNPDINITLWGIGTDFDSWIERNPNTLHILSKANINLVDRRLKGQQKFNKTVLSPDDITSQKETIVIPMALSYETRQSIKQYCRHIKIKFLDISAV
ncbi:sulfotransferase domain-containing protein [Marinomonas balearica]|uniref:Sulfotransferase domain-containing protein n=1 Tax=Marinomonas balearica TaxID=491947 RepID=A0A4R6M6N6_9GAMM|nr:sulfotransferase domain-containing protein [Marinomonas balearica]TDO96250.1 sulfotransferase domain-containing protein [Marinomonas balearica]